MELFEYQKNIVEKAVEHLNKNTNCRFNLFLEMGLGKTIIALEIAKRMNPASILIVCPKSLIEMWVYNVSKVLPKFARVDKLEYLSDSTQPTFCVVNYEYFLKVKDTCYIDICIFDEVHKAKNINSKTHKQLSEYVIPTYCLCLTGTPITKDYMDLYGILTCTMSRIWEGMFPTQFKTRYILNGGTKRTEELMERIRPYTVFGKLTEYIDMPDAADIVIPIQPSLEQLVDLNYIYNSKEPALTRIVRAQQVTSGISHKYSPKQKCCINLVNDILSDGQKVVIFTKFDDEFDFFMRHFDGICTGINGKTKDREFAKNKFQHDPNCKVFIGNLQTAGVGLTLTAANKCIFYSETHNWADAEQSKYRIYRIGQNQSCIYYHLLMLDTIDELIYNSNCSKTNLIEDFKNKYGGN